MQISTLPFVLQKIFLDKILIINYIHGLMFLILQLLKQFLAWNRLGMDCLSRCFSLHLINVLLASFTCVFMKNIDL